jgi:hypothetical protein
VLSGQVEAPVRIPGTPREAAMIDPAFLEQPADRAAEKPAGAEHHHSL